MRAVSISWKGKRSCRLLSYVITYPLVGDFGHFNTWNLIVSCFWCLGFYVSVKSYIRSYNLCTGTKYPCLKPPGPSPAHVHSTSAMSYHIHLFHCRAAMLPVAYNNPSHRPSPNQDGTFIPCCTIPSDPGNGLCLPREQPSSPHIAKRHHVRPQFWLFPGSCRNF